jgi:hypothetical protein
MVCLGFVQGFIVLKAQKKVNTQIGPLKGAAASTAATTPKDEEILLYGHSLYYMQLFAT